MYKRKKQISKLCRDGEFVLKWLELQIHENNESYIRDKAIIEECISQGKEPPAAFVDFVKMTEDVMRFIERKKLFKDYLKADKALREHVKPFGVTPEQVDKMSEDEIHAMFQMGPEKYKEMLKDNKQAIRKERKNKRKRKK